MASDTERVNEVLRLYLRLTRFADFDKREPGEPDVPLTRERRAAVKRYLGIRDG